jgi:hypothetical protein
MKRLATALACCILCGQSRATDAPAGDIDLPQPFDANTVTPLIQNSPFIRSVSLSDSLILTGLAYIDGKPVATILNTETSQSYSVSEDPNPMGWKLTEATATTDINRAQAKIAIGGEVVVIRYNKDAMTPESLKKLKGKSGSNSPPGDSGDRFRRSEGRGPSEEDRKKYESLSEAGKEKLRNFFRENMDKLRTAGNDEERRQFVRSAFEKIEKEDKGGK